jgi:hypothetical protein
MERNSSCEENYCWAFQEIPSTLLNLWHEYHSWLSHYTTSWRNPSSRTMVLGSTQPVTEMSTRNLPGGKERTAQPSVSRLPRKYRILDLSEPYGLPRPVAGIVLPSCLFYWTWKLISVFTRARTARWTKSIHFQHIYLTPVSNTIIPSMTRPSKHFSFLPCMLHAPNNRHSFDYSHSHLQ